jgi:hypothetical protein
MYSEGDSVAGRAHATGDLFNTCRPVQRPLFSHVLTFIRSKFVSVEQVASLVEEEFGHQT